MDNKRSKIQSTIKNKLDDSQKNKWVILKIYILWSVQSKEENTTHHKMHQWTLNIQKNQDDNTSKPQIQNDVSLQILQ